MKLNKKGFTIIEVLIVLAIAGVIILGVLVAVPTLQRNNRNTARNTEAARVASLVNQCLANRNGVTGSCDEATEIGYSTSEFAQLTSFAQDNSTVTATPSFPGAAIIPANNVNTVAVGFNRQCRQEGDQQVLSTTGSRAFTVTFNIETTSGTTTRCLRG